MSASSSDKPLASIEQSDARFSMRMLLAAMTAGAVIAAIIGVILRNVAEDTRQRLLLFWGIWLVGSIMLAAVAVQRRRAAEQLAGRALLKLPMWPSANVPAWLNWTVAAKAFFLLLMLPLVSLLVAGGPGSLGSDWLMQFCLPSMYAFMVTANVVPLVLWSHHVRFCENGILADRVVLLWSELIEHRFTDAHPPKLELKSANDIHNRAWILLTVERDQVDAINAIIAEKTRDAVPLPSDVPVSFSQTPLFSVFRYPHFRNHLIFVALSVAAGAWLIYLGWVQTTGTREFQDALLFAIFAWSFLQGWRFRWLFRNSGAPIARVFGRRDILGFAANLGAALGLYYATINLLWPFWWMGYVAGAAFVYFVISTVSYYFLTQLDLRPERAIIPGALSWAWERVELHRWDAARGRLVLGRGWRRVTAFVPPDQTEAVDRLLREKRLLNEPKFADPSSAEPTFMSDVPNTPPEIQIERKPNAAVSKEATDVRFSIRAMLIVMAVVAVATSALAAYIRSFPADLRMELTLYWGVLAALLVMLFGFHAWQRRRAELNAGRVLMELDRHIYFLPRTPRLATTLVGILSLLAAPAMWVYGSHNIARGGPLSSWLWQFNYGTVSCIVASGSAVTYFWWRRIRLAENGLIGRSQYFPWTVCNRWQWDARFKNVAVVFTTTGGKIAFEVPEQERAAVEALLERYVYVRHGYVPFKEKA